MTSQSTGKEDPLSRIKTTNNGIDLLSLPSTHAVLQIRVFFLVLPNSTSLFRHTHITGHDHRDTRDKITPEDDGTYSTTTVES